jgi:hypothetical protein
MTDATGIFFQGLLFFLLLHIIGHPIITVVLRRRGIPWRLKSLDFIERLPLEFVAGGIVVYIVALLMTPLRVLMHSHLWGSLEWQQFSTFINIGRELPQFLGSHRCVRWLSLS